MPTYKTPGVFVEEIPLFPPSVAEVETAIPAFVGYTEKAEHLGEKLRNEPTRIKSLKEFEERFGYGPKVEVTEVVLDATNNVTSARLKSTYLLYDSMQLFYANGGGVCYVVSVGSYQDDVDSVALSAGLALLRKEDEPTMLLFPDGVKLAPDKLAGVQTAALKQAADLGDRVAILDLPEPAPDAVNVEGDWNTAVANFRDMIGINNLKYGAAYTPHLQTSLPKTITFRDLKGKLTKYGVPFSIESLIPDPTTSSGLAIVGLLTTLNNAMADVDRVKANIDTLTGGKSVTDHLNALSGTYTSLTNRAKAGDPSVTAADARTAFRDYVVGIYTAVHALVNAWALGSGFSSGGEARRRLEDLISNTLVGSGSNKGAVTLLNSYTKEYGDRVGDTTLNAPYQGSAFDWTGVSQWGTVFTAVTFEPGPFPKNGNDDAEILENLSTASGYFDTVAGRIASVVDDVVEAARSAESAGDAALLKVLPSYKSIVDKVKSALTSVPPSGVMAGVYSRVDAERGVFKSPANVSLNRIKKTLLPIDDERQETLNVDVTAGKSINAIRKFAGKGILVWGARTLAGNDNEWRYVSVRRFFNMVEESVKKSTSWAVFEPNDANLWVKLRSMIENYLIKKWREGALQGAKPEQAFYVKVGLNQTMTTQDILEGRLIVEIGMAVVRPAEFIILRFMHKLPES